MTTGSRTSKAGSVGNAAYAQSADINALGGSLIQYDHQTSSTTGVTSVQDISTITFTAVGSRFLAVRVHIGLVVQNTASGLVKVLLRDGSGNALGAFLNRNMAAADRAECDAQIVLSPSAGSTTYKLSIQTSGGTVDANANSSDPGPLQFQIWDIGPSF